MIRRIIIILFLSLAFITLIPKEKSHSWGFYGHKRINRMAVFCLPPGMVSFYKKHIEFITNHSVDADKRRYSDKNEAPRHYIDIDHYGKNGFEIVPKFWNDAVLKFSEDTLLAYGIVPWQIEKQYFKLVTAFKNENIDHILQYSSDLGHYVGDAHVPLHTTENYNGQLTGQKGIHGFWESRIPELKADGYDYFLGRAHYIESPLKMAWKAVYDSHLEVDSVLKFEALLSKNFPQDQKYGYENRNNILTKVYSEAYTNQYDLMIKGQVERRMRQSIIMVSSLWYSAWINAGKPNLDKLEQIEISDSLKTATQKQDEVYNLNHINDEKSHEE